MFFNSLPDHKILALSKFKAFDNGNFNVAQMVQFFSDRVENIVGKGENAGYLTMYSKDWSTAFSPLPTMFSNTIFFKFIISKHVYD